MIRVAIIGHGVTGVAAALRLRELQPEWEIVMISGESTYHYSRPALMYVFMGHMRYQDTKPYEDSFWDQKRIELVRDWVVGLDAEAGQLTLKKRGTLHFDKLLLATGSKSNKFGWPGQNLDGVQGLYDLMDLKRLYDNVKGAEHGVIVGGGLIGIEFAEMLHSRGVHVTLLVRESSYWNNVLPSEESELVNRVIREAGMDLQLETELVEIVGNDAGRAVSVKTNRGDTLPCQVVGLTAGVHPNVDLVRDSGIDVGRGILVNRQLETNVPNVYAAGDCAEIVVPDAERNWLEQVWYTGKAQGRHVAESMCGDDKEYSPGIWYNSAKFLDLEYQVYGAVNRRLADEKNFYWQHPSEPKSIRLVYDDEKILGFQTMGVRYRHRVCERWLAEERPIDYVVEHLAEANFDPEFFMQYESDVRQAFGRVNA